MYVAILNQARAWRRISRAVANFVGRARQVLRRLASAWMTTSEANPASRQAQALGHQVLDASSNYERLRHCAERRETEFLCTPGNRAGSEINSDFIAGNDRLLLCCDLLRKLLAQALHQFWHFHAQRTIVIRIAQVCL